MNDVNPKLVTTINGLFTGFGCYLIGSYFHSGELGFGVWFVLLAFL